MTYPKDQALAELAYWADAERDCRQMRIDCAITAREAGATLTEMSQASKISRQGLGKYMRKFGITVDKYRDVSVGLES